MKKFEKIVTWIQEEVRSGRKVSGEKLPSEQELSEQFQVSRQTVRRALEELVKENIVESRRGSGSYICEDAGMLLGNTERRADHEEKRIAVMLTYIDTYIFPIIVREIEKKGNTGRRNPSDCNDRQFCSKGADASGRIFKNKKN